MIHNWDLETIPEEGKKLRLIMPEFKANKNVKDPEKIKAQIQEKKHAFFRDAALSPYTGRIALIGYYDGKNFIIQRSDETEEADMLKTFWASFNDAKTNKFAGWRIKYFDLKFLWGRSIVLGVEIPVTAKIGRQWNERFVDLHDIYTAFEYKAFVSLDNAAKSLGLYERVEKDVTGTDFYIWWNNSEEKKQKCIQYLKDDLTVTYNICEMLKKAYRI